MSGGLRLGVFGCIRWISAEGRLVILGCIG